MKNIKVLSALAVMVLFLLANVSVHAAPLRTQQKRSATPAAGTPVYGEQAYPSASYDAPTRWEEKPWYLFLGFDLGMSTYSAFNDNTITDASRTGIHLGPRALIAHYWQDWVADAGIGWSFISNSGNDVSGNKYKVTTRTGYLDFSPRFRLSQNWQLGPELEYYLGSDKGLNPNIFNELQNNGVFLGVQAIYEWQGAQSDNRYRFGGRWLIDLNAENRDAHIIQLFVQIGFNIFGSPSEPVAERPRNLEQVNDNDLNREAYVAPVDPLPLATPEPTPDAEPVVAGTPEPAPAPIVYEKQQKVILTLDVNDLPFAFDSARLPKYNQDRVREVGRFLGEHKKSWRELIVSGHTDERGSDAYNNKLSTARAQTIRQLLIEGGAPRGKISAKGFGERKPRDKHHNEKAWARNRRVELEFRGVKDLVIIRDALKH